MVRVRTEKDEKAADKTVTVKAGQKTTVEFVDQPQTNPMDLAIMKVDAETGMSVPQGAASLTGAEFTVEFYTQQFDNQPRTIMSPARTWVFKTDENGEIIFDKGSMKVEMMTESFSDVFDKFAAIYKILFGKKDLEEVQYANRIMSSVEKRSYCGLKTSNNE